MIFISSLLVLRPRWHGPRQPEKSALLSLSCERPSLAGTRAATHRCDNGPESSPQGESHEIIGRCRLRSRARCHRAAHPPPRRSHAPRPPRWRSRRSRAAWSIRGRSPSCPTAACWSPSGPVACASSPRTASCRRRSPACPKSSHPVRAACTTSCSIAAMRRTRPSISAMPNRPTAAPARRWRARAWSMKARRGSTTSR